MTTSLAPEEDPTIQSFGSLAPVRIGLTLETRARSVAALNRVLAHTTALRDLYRKAHWQTSGATFYELHRLYDEHHAAQSSLMDELAERVQALGGVALALARDVAQESRLTRAPRGREAPRDQLARLLGAHETILLEARPLARQAASDGDDGTNDLLVGAVVRTNEKQSWFIGEQLAARGP